MSRLNSVSWIKQIDGELFQREYNRAARDVVSGAIGGALFYAANIAGGILVHTLLAVIGFLMILLAALFYYFLNRGRAYSLRIEEWRSDGGQPERKRNEWPEGRAS